MRKYKLVILQAIVAIILLCTSVYAGINVNLSFRVTSRKLEPGEEFKVRLTLNEIYLTEGNSGITDIEGYINYNEDVIEPLTGKSITTVDGKVVIGDQKLDLQDVTGKDVSQISYSSEGVVTFNGTPATGNDSKIMIGLKEPITETTQILEVTFKVKENAKPGNVEDAVEYSLFEVSGGEEITDQVTQVISIEVLEAEGVSNNVVDTNNNVVNNTVKNEVTNNTVKNETVKNETKNEVVNNTTKNEVANNTVKNETVKNETKNEVVNNTTKNETVKNTVNNTVNNTTNNTVNNTVNNTANKTNNTTNKTNTTNNTVDNTVASSTLPKTGASLVIVPIMGVIVIAYIAYNRYMKYKEVD